MGGHPAGEIVRYDTGRYPFRETVARALGLGPDIELEKVHEEPGGAYYPLLDRERDQSTDWHRRFYAGWDRPGGVSHLYRRFLLEVVAERGDPGPLLYQRVPTFRVHLPGNVAVGEFHRDLDYGHQAEELNWWLPMTLARETATVWIESAPGRKDFEPANLGYGEAFLFSGAMLEHGNRVNVEGFTRVSFDFRVLAASAHRDTGKRSVSLGVPMTVGGYWEQL